jgi:ribosomal protein S18 acetylase RimI-like enzyme
MPQHAPHNAMTEADEIARFLDRCSDLMRALLDALADAPDRPRTFPQIEDAMGWPRRRIASVLGGVAHLRQTEFGGRRPYRFHDARWSASGRWEMWMDSAQARAVRADAVTVPRIRMQRVSESPNVEVRLATADDAQAIGAVFDAAVRAGWAYLGELVEEPMFAPEDWDGLVADHASPNVLLVANDRDGRVLGFAAAHPEDGEMFLLFVHPDYAGRGVGRTLLGAADDALRAAGRTEAFLFVHEQNERALAVYATAGYRPDGSARESEFRGAAIRELRLVKRL